VRVAGGAQILDDGKTFNIGERNYTMLRKVLWKNNLLIAGEEVGGSVPRTIALDMATGETRLRVQGQERML
jgi:chemotaxis protein CheD